MSSATRHSPSEIWESVLSQLVLRVTRQNYENWLRNTAADRFDGTVLVVKAPSELGRDWLSTRMRTLVSQALMTVAGPGLAVRFEVSSVSAGKEPFEPLQPSLVRQGGGQANPRFTFDSFIPGGHNQVALTAALDVANNHASPYSPLFINGPSGSGKTHLLHAISHQSRAQDGLSLLVTADQFISDFTGAVRGRTGPAFRAQYRDIDLFLLDDVQLLVGKKASQIEFYQTVACLHDAGKRVVIAGDHHALMCETAARFDTSLHWGLVATIEHPEIADRVRFLEARLREREIVVDPEVLHYVALRMKSSVRELEGALNRVLAHARITAEPLSIDFAARALQAVSASPLNSPSLYQPSDILTAACSYLHVGEETVRSPKRDRATTYARHVVMYLLRKEGNMTYAAIAALLQKADHSTVVHACSQLERELKVSAGLRADIDAIRVRLRQAPTAA